MRRIIAAILALATMASVSWSANSRYVILTTTGIVSQSIQLTNFVASKQQRGFTVSVVNNTATGWGGGVGQVAATNLRTWLQGTYTNTTGDLYVLFIGDPRPDVGDVPMKMCYPTNNVDYPTDHFYAELTSNWDVDGDGLCGEWEDIDTNDFPTAMEAYVGRIPFYGNMVVLDSILAKTVAYENATYTNLFWRGLALLAMERDYVQQ